MKIYGFDVIGMAISQDGPYEVTKWYVKGHVTHLKASFVYGYSGKESVFTIRTLKPTHLLEVCDA